MAVAKSFGKFVRAFTLGLRRACHLTCGNEPQVNHPLTPMIRSKFLFFVAGLLIGCPAGAADRVGPFASGRHLTATHQWIRPAGQSVEFGGRPVDLAASPDGHTLYVKDNRGLVVIDAATWRIRQEFKFNGGGGSVHGIAVTRDGSRIYATTPQDILWEIATTASGTLEEGRKLVLPGPGGKGDPVLAGLALSADEKTAYVCLSRNNSLGILDLASGKLDKQVPVGVAPYDVVLSADAKKAFVSNWGGRHPRQGEPTAKSSGTDALVDARGVAASGTVSVVDLEQGTEQI